MVGNSQPFHTIVVTSPDGAAADAALKGPLDPPYLPFLDHDRPRILSISDPFGTRVGSGGGTLNALSEAEKLNSNVSTTSGSLCIIHAGGQSSRCPTQMVLGKAWTSLPMVQNRKHFVSNPTYILMKSLSVLLRDLPQGSVVVAASDVVLDLPDKPLDFGNLLHDKVLGIAVPTSLYTAKNHGVFCLSSAMSMDELAIQVVDQFLQKPSISEMENTPGCSFERNDGEKMAWIDTGIVIFLPEAADGLRKMMLHDLQCCTQRGLEELFQQSKINAYDEFLCDMPPQTCDQYAKRYAKKVELYSHILLAISTRGSLNISSRKDHLASYLTDLSSSGLEKDLLEKIYTRMSLFELQVVTVSNGSFTHLGTSVELSRFLVEGATRKGGTSQWTHRAHTFIENLSTDANSVIMNSIINQPSVVSIGKNTVLEHCDICASSIKIGSDCIISGWRGIWNYDVVIPDNAIFQMIPLKKLGNQKSSSLEYVCIYLGIQDEVKARSTYFGIPFDQLFRHTKLQPTDLWTDDITDPMVWNAKLHIVITEYDSNLDWSPFHWIKTLNLAARFDDESNASLKRWQKARRLSLSEILDKADTSKEFSFRSDVTLKIINRQCEAFSRINHVFQERIHEEVRFDFILDDLNFSLVDDAPLEKLNRMIDVMEDLIIRNIKNQNDMDISCRAFMVLGAFLRDLAFSLNRIQKKSARRNPAHTHFSAFIKFDQDGFHGVSPLVFNDFKARIHHAIVTIDIQIILNYAEECERIGHTITSQCTSNKMQKLPRITSNDLPSFDVWIVSTAPARVDLAGGWSDTPPISYEYGGAVTNIAVLVDKAKPLSARCRRLRGLDGIILSIENRDICSGELKETESVHILKLGDLLDFSNPSGKCSLLKCVLFATGLLTPTLCEKEPEKTINYLLAEHFLEKDCRFGIELVSTSLLPHGSGLGTSSILSACILASFSSCIGIKEANNRDWLIGKVLLVEQLLSTGGGWQDQCGGVFPGVKLCTSSRNQYPIQVSVKTLDLPQVTLDLLNKHMILGFTGKPRLAKNILQRVLRRWALRKEEIVSTVVNLVADAHNSLQIIQDGDLTRLGEFVSRYWTQKCVMAGGIDSGVEPPEVKELLDILKETNSIVGGTLCGAGGGGFLFLLLNDCVDMDAIRNIQMKMPKGDDFTWHSCEVSCEGLTTFVTSDKDFNFSWHFNLNDKK